MPCAKSNGPVALTHPELAASQIHELPGPMGGGCAAADSKACRHGTFVAGVLSAKRGSPAPAICPDCTLILRPVFREISAGVEPVQVDPLGIKTSPLDLMTGRSI